MTATAAEPGLDPALDWDPDPRCEIRIYQYLIKSRRILSESDPCGKPATHIVKLHGLTNCAETLDRYICTDCLAEELAGDYSAPCDRCSAPTVLEMRPIKP
jgi:hypothetical protein